MAQHAEAPLAAAASRFLGEGGSCWCSRAAPSRCSATCAGHAELPRSLYAFGRDGFLPRRSRGPPFLPHAVRGDRRPRPARSALAISSSFRHLAILSNVSVLALYFLCCAAALRLVSRKAPKASPPSPSRARVIPVAAMLVIVWILSHATGQELAVLAATFAVASALYG